MFLCHRNVWSPLIPKTPCWIRRNTSWNRMRSKLRSCNAVSNMNSPKHYGKNFLPRQWRNLLALTFYSVEISSMQKYGRRSLAEEVLWAKAKLLRTTISGKLLISHWRCANAADICNSNFTQFVVDNSIDHLRENLSYFSARCQFRVLNEFMGYVPELECKPGTEFESVRRSILIIACSMLLLPQR